MIMYRENALPYFFLAHQLYIGHLHPQSHYSPVAVRSVSTCQRSCMDEMKETNPRIDLLYFVIEHQTGIGNLCFQYYYSEIRSF